MPPAARIALLVAAWAVAALLITKQDGRVDPDASRRVLAEDGYRDIVLAERPGLSSFFAGCDKAYEARTPFSATMAGRHVEGIVCSGSRSGRAPQVRRTD